MRNKPSKLKMQVFFLGISLLLIPVTPSVCHAAIHAPEAQSLHASDCHQHASEHNAKHHTVIPSIQIVAALTQGGRVFVSQDEAPVQLDTVLPHNKTPFLKSPPRFLSDVVLSQLRYSQQVRVSHFATAPPA